MSKEQLVLRLLSSVANIDSQRLRSGFLEEMDFARIAPAMNSLSDAPIYIDDTPNISAMELRTKARRLQAEAGLDLVIVDYLQLMQATTTNRDANRVQEVSEISRGLKALARELSVPVIALSQLSRQPEMRESREPRLSDLRESGAIEQDADLVMFLWREKERAGEEQESDGEVINLKLAKHRNGPTGEIKLWFKKSQTRFVSYAGERYAGRRRLSGVAPERCAKAPVCVLSPLRQGRWTRRFVRASRRGRDSHEWSDLDEARIVPLLKSPTPSGRSRTERATTPDPSSVQPPGRALIYPR